MPMYQLTPLINNAEELKAAVVNAVLEMDRYELPSNAGWLIHYKGTSIELSNLIGITGQEKGVASAIGSVLIVPFTSYYGRASTAMWEWLKTRFESGA